MALAAAVRAAGCFGLGQVWFSATASASPPASAGGSPVRSA